MEINRKPYAVHLTARVSFIVEGTREQAEKIAEVVRREIQGRPLPMESALYVVRSAMRGDAALDIQPDKPIVEALSATCYRCGGRAGLVLGTPDGKRFPCCFACNAIYARELGSERVRRYQLP